MGLGLSGATQSQPGVDAPKPEGDGVKPANGIGQELSSQPHQGVKPLVGEVAAPQGAAIPNQAVNLGQDAGIKQVQAPAAQDRGQGQVGFDGVASVQKAGLEGAPKGMEALRGQDPQGLAQGKDGMGLQAPGKEVQPEHAHAHAHQHTHANVHKGPEPAAQPSKGQEGPKAAQDVVKPQAEKSGVQQVLDKTVEFLKEHAVAIIATALAAYFIGPKAAAVVGGLALGWNYLNGSKDKDKEKDKDDRSMLAKMASWSPLGAAYTAISGLFSKGKDDAVKQEQIQRQQDQKAADLKAADARKDADEGMKRMQERQSFGA